MLKNQLEEYRVARDNHAYVFADFVEYYGDRAQEKWDEAIPYTAPTPMADLQNQTSSELVLQNQESCQVLMPTGSAEQPAPAEKPSPPGAANSSTSEATDSGDVAPAAAPALAAPAPVPQGSAGQSTLNAAATAAATQSSAAQPALRVADFTMNLRRDFLDPFYDECV